MFERSALLESAVRHLRGDACDRCHGPDTRPVRLAGLGWHGRPMRGSLAALLATDVERLSPDGAIDFLVDLQRHAAWLASVEARALVRAAGPRPVHRGITVVDRQSDAERTLVLTDEAREEIAAALHRSPGVVHDQVVTARLLGGPLAGTMDALASGAISAAHARVIAEQALRLRGDDPDGAADEFADACTRLESRVLPSAAALTASETRSAARRAVVAVDPAGAERRREQARAAIDVRVYAEDDGLGAVFARLPIADAARVHATIDAHARGDQFVADGYATLGQRRAAALVDLVCAGGGGGAGGGAQGGGPAGVQVLVEVDLPTLLGLADNAAAIALGTSTAEPVSAGVVRDLLTDPRVPSSLRRLVTDPVTGALLDRGRQQYEVTDALRAFVVARDGACRFPGCTRSASTCQVDHAVAWDDGGGTDRDNLGSLCTRHHQLKTLGGWDIVEPGTDGAVRWRSPTGRHYDVRPPRLHSPPAPPTTDDPPF